MSKETTKGDKKMPVCEQNFYVEIPHYLKDIAESLERMNILKALEIRAKYGNFTNEEVAAAVEVAMK